MSAGEILGDIDMTPQAMIRSKKMMVLLGSALALVLVVGCSSDSSEVGPPATISESLPSGYGSSSAAQWLQSGSGDSTGIWVNGTGKATGDPDLGVLELGVEALANKASEARDMAAKAIDATVSMLKANNIQDKDLQTSQFSINPQYDMQEIRRCTDGLKEEGKGTECRTEFERVLIGYQVTNILTVKVRNFESISSIIDGATEAAGNLVRINAVNFTIEDTKALLEVAREEAIADLLARANSMATLSGVELGKLVFLSESGGAPPQSFARTEAAAFGFGGDQSTSILAGELDVIVNVQGVFAIAD
ncbi:MAG: DUF541 domain-containing protein [SAR202 cluster bacterium]|jgi:uncharacterized protein YggE|nr:DUF541 domain-containing protein [SAR202 cluster bacterium]|tara:strand:+ start:702 stop:1619 length:918 start_codon:yes stop_codon:yes gene_type:complete